MDNDYAKAKAIKIARQVLDGKIALVLGCRTVQHPLDILGLRMDKDFTIFVGVDSETDELPVGDERRHWHPNALRNLDPKLKAFEARYRPYVEDACRKLIARLG